MIALSADAVTAMKSCLNCHKKGQFQKWETPLHRAVGLPKLVLANDFYADRCIEDITGIEIMDILPRKAAAKSGKFHSGSFTISDPSGQNISIDTLKAYRHTGIPVKHAGEGRGYHGIEEYEGVPLMDIFAEKKIKPP